MRLKKLTYPALAALFALGLGACADKNPEKPLTLQLLHFADIDGGRDIVNNSVRFSALVKHFRQDYPHTLLLTSGDNWIPGPEYGIASDDALASVVGVPSAGRAHVAYLNALDIKASAFGNHEFDNGPGAVANIIAQEQKDGKQWPGAQFPYLAANLDFSKDASIANLIGQDGADYTALYNQVAASTVVDLQGEKIGIVGAVTPALAGLSSSGDIGITPADGTMEALAAIIQTSVDALTATGINKIIVLGHMQQIALEKTLATLLKDVDIIIAGGSNTILADSNDRLRDGDTAVDTYPLQFSSAKQEPILVVNTDGDYTYLGRLVVEFDSQGLINLAALQESINGAYATDEQGLKEHNLATSDAIPEVAAISAALTSALATRAGNVFGLSTVYLNGERKASRTEETNLGNLITQANLAYAQSIDSSTVMAFKSGGTIRASIGACTIPPGATGDDALVCQPPAGIAGVNQPGQISQLDLETALRFNNGLRLVTLTGTQLKDMLEHSVSEVAEGATPGSFPQIAGATLAFDPTQPARMTDENKNVTVPGQRIRDFTILDNNGAAAGGQAVNLVTNGVLNSTAANQSFRLVTLDYLVGGGDNYPFPEYGDITLQDLVTEGIATGAATFADNGREQDTVAEYLLVNFPPDQNEDTPAYSQADTPAKDDKIITNLALE